jgi:hypothetical protein
MDWKEQLDELLEACAEAAQYERGQAELAANARRYETLRESFLNSLPRPIPVSERLPEDGRPVLCYAPGLCRIWSEDDGRERLVRSDLGQWLLTALNDDGWWRCYGTQLSPNDITHWLPLPPKPE